MSKRQILMVLGVWIMIFLFVGLPSWLDKVSSLVVGIIIILIAVSMKPKERSTSVENVPYVESNNGKMASVTRVDSMITNSDSTTIPS